MRLSAQSSSATPLLLDAFAHLRSSCVEEACERVGHVFSPHQLQPGARARGLDVRHNRVALGRSFLNVLSYGAEVQINPGERGDFYLVQVPLSGRARLCSAGQSVDIHGETVSVLHPRTDSRMQWSEDCTMLLLQLPSDLLRSYLGATVVTRRCSYDCAVPAVAAWRQAMLDLAHNLHRHGCQWLAQPSVMAALEGFLVATLAGLLHETEPESSTSSADGRSLRRAKEYMHAHLDRPLQLQEIARHACVSPRTLELLFKRQGEPTPLAYARQLRLRAAHDALKQSARQGAEASVTHVAQAHGFAHLGRFSAQYQAAFGCLPSETLRRH